MNKRIISIALVVLVLPFFVIAPAFAVEEESNNSTDEVTTTSTEETETETLTAEERQAAREERIQKRKEAIQLALTTAQKLRIANRCKAAQGLVTAAGARAKSAETRRDTVHAGLVERLNSLVEKLKTASIDTTELESQIAVLQTKITAFNTALTNYQQAITDLSELDCEADPEAFQVSLQDARTLRAAVVTAAQDIRAYVRDTIKPTLAELRQQLETKAESEEE